MFSINGMELFSSFKQSINGVSYEEKNLIKKNNQGEGPAGLQWATVNHWDTMPGGRLNNPAVSHWNAEKGSGYPWQCRYFAQTRYGGCWQSGCLACWTQAGHSSKFVPWNNDWQ